MKGLPQEEVVRSPRNWREHLPGKPATCAIAVLLAFGLAGSSPRATGTDLCRLTSKAALSSCRKAAQSDLWLAIGKCDNLADPEARRSCRAQASVDVKDALDSCLDQHATRQEVCARLGGAPYDPVIDPADFVAVITNPYFPLTPGTTYIYEGQTAQGLEHNEVFVTHKTKAILGITCIEVRDRLTVNGELIEDTLDWFAQDVDGNVWYLGENAMEIAGGEIVDLAGSWEAGVDGAKPGIIMEAHPAVGDFYRQEFLLSEAEDVGEVLSTTQAVTVPAGSYERCLKTKDTSPLEPDAVEHKFYAAEVGLVLETDPTTGEKLELLEITTK